MSTGRNIAVGAMAMNLSRGVGYTNTPSGDSSAEFIIARVKSVLLDDSDKDLFDRLGGYRAIGSIECVTFVNFNDPNAVPIIARPLNSNLSHYPVKNEIVLVKSLIRKEAQNNIDNYLSITILTSLVLLMHQNKTQLLMLLSLQTVVK